ncbi:MAG: hypothetical protein LBM67_08400 [Lentimicrobiaceae bacterium]|jgi:hypothetical protein|nr:hypothetical protein [Lentimicrobiaceae bacterium]
MNTTVKIKISNPLKEITMQKKELRDLLLHAFTKGLNAAQSTKPLSIRQASRISGIDNRMIKQAILNGELPAKQSTHAKNSKITIERCVFEAWRDTL